MTEHLLFICSASTGAAETSACSRQLRGTPWQLKQSVHGGSRAERGQEEQSRLRAETANAAPEQQVLGLKTRYITRETCLHRYTTCCIMRWNVLRNNIPTLITVTYHISTYAKL